MAEHTASKVFTSTNTVRSKQTRVPFTDVFVLRFKVNSFVKFNKKLISIKKTPKSIIIKKFTKISKSKSQRSDATAAKKTTELIKIKNNSPEVLIKKTVHSKVRLRKKNSFNNEYTCYR